VQWSAWPFWSASLAIASILLVLNPFEVYDYCLTLDREVDYFILYEIDRHSHAVL
jgi:hypothetical protein